MLSGGPRPGADVPSVYGPRSRRFAVELKRAGAGRGRRARRAHAPASGVARAERFLDGLAFINKMDRVGASSRRRARFQSRPSCQANPCPPPRELMRWPRLADAVAPMLLIAESTTGVALRSRSRSAVDRSRSTQGRARPVRGEDRRGARLLAVCGTY